MPVEPGAADELCGFSPPAFAAGWLARLLSVVAATTPARAERTRASRSAHRSVAASRARRVRLVA